MKLASLQTFKQVNNWKKGDKLIEDKIVEKEKAHSENLLHLSAHLLIVDEDKRILSRKRKVDDLRYSDLWTSTIGVHVLFNSDYLGTLKAFLPIEKKLEYMGEFLVRDEWENEINGLYLMRANQDELPAKFLKDKKFFAIAELAQLVRENKTTPHLKEALNLLEKII